MFGEKDLTISQNSYRIIQTSKKLVAGNSNHSYYYVILDYFISKESGFLFWIESATQMRAIYDNIYNMWIGPKLNII